MKILDSILEPVLASIKEKAALARRFPRINDFLQLARLNRPIGIYLLFWPTMWALWLAADGLPSLHNLLVFVFGVVLMRSAGCVINDYADRQLDGHVKRTRNRPLVTGKISEKEALLYFSVMVLVSFLLVLTTNSLTIMLSFAGLALAACYPFAKRYTYLPQVVLGAAFGWSIPMAYAAEANALTTQTWLLFLANLMWTVAYDTQYAMVDRDDDVKIGIKSTAILFGEMDNIMIGAFQVLTILTLAMLGQQLDAGWIYYVALIIAGAGFVYQQLLTKNRQRDACFKAFLSNHWVGAILFAGIVLS